MKALLFATTALACSLYASNVYAGGDDHFGGNETSAHSDYGGTTGFGSTSQQGSAWSGQQDFTFDRLSQVDSIGPGGTHVVDTYSIDGGTGNASWISRNEDGSGWISIPDETVKGGRRREFVPAPASKPRAAAPAPAPAPQPAPQPGPVEMPTLQAPPVQIAPPEPEKRVLAPEMGPPRNPTVVNGKPRKNTVATLEDTLRAIQRAQVQPDSPGLNKAQRALARAINMGVGAATGAVGGGKMQTGTLGKIEGALIGAAVKEAIAVARGGETPYDAIVKDVTTVSQSEFEAAARQARGLTPKERERLIDGARDVTRENLNRERREAGSGGPQSNKGKGNGQRKK